ncbi:hypothetical protein CDAR_94061 [Caerostris darwini]|uniref:Uncharacterized protein n=1 Tax=Caerostris darwini TaxID=1538125 RepID=A0AAV4NK90_9ARAC|nr:hypothetical protein CDAR_94061 [Caerostris darwini]
MPPVRSLRCGEDPQSGLGSPWSSCGKELSLPLNLQQCQFYELVKNTHFTTASDSADGMVARFFFWEVRGGTSFVLAAGDTVRGGGHQRRVADVAPRCPMKRQEERGVVTDDQNKIARCFRQALFDNSGRRPGPIPSSASSCCLDTVRNGDEV